MLDRFGRKNIPIPFPQKSGLWEAIAEGIFDVKPNTFLMKSELIEYCDMYPPILGVQHWGYISERETAMITVLWKYSSVV